MQHLHKRKAHEILLLKPEGLRSFGRSGYVCMPMCVCMYVCVCLLSGRLQWNKGKANELKEMSRWPIRGKYFHCPTGPYLIGH